MADYYTCEHNYELYTGSALNYTNYCGIAHSTIEAAEACCHDHNSLCKRDGVNALRRVRCKPRASMHDSDLHVVGGLLRDIVPPSTKQVPPVTWDDYINQRRATEGGSPRSFEGFLEVLRATYIEIGDRGTYTLARWAERLSTQPVPRLRAALMDDIEDARGKADKARPGGKAFWRNHSRFICLDFLRRYHDEACVLLTAHPKLDHLEPIVDPQPQPQLDPMIDNNKTANEIAAAIAGILTQGQGQQQDVQALAKQAARDAIAEATRDGTLTMSVEIIRPDKVVMRLPKGEALHAAFTPTMQAIAAGESPLLKGPAGTGKSMLARQIATALDLPFMHMSLSGGTGEHHFVGTRLPNKRGEFEHVGTPFLDAFENGGVMLLDEMDACDENVLLCINNGLANGELPVPGRDAKPYATKHKDFRLIAAANTWGSGPNAMYAGRNQLDAATLDRFMLTEVDYDRALERSLVPDFPLLVSAWHTLRDQASRAQLRRVVSMRGLIRYAKMMRTHNWDVEKCLKHATQSWSSDERNACKVLEG